jgi:hypothetical protein
VMGLHEAVAEPTNRGAGVKHSPEIGIRRASKACRLMMLSGALGTTRTCFSLVV